MATPIELRLATLADIPYIHKTINTWNALLKMKQKSEKEIKNMLKKSIVIVAWYEKRRIGHVGLTEDSDRYWIDHLWVDEDMRQRHIGSQLINEAIQRTQPGKPIYISILKRNPGYLFLDSFYRRMGFTNLVKETVHQIQLMRKN